MGSDRSLEPSNFEGASLEQMRGWVESGAGAESMHTAGKDWGKENEFLMNLAKEVRGELDKAKVSFESQSGDAMQNAMSPVVLWTEVAAENASVQAEKMNAQGDAFKTVQSSIPAKSEEQPVPDDNMFEEGFDNMFNGGTDAEKANAANEKLRQEAVQAFDSYGSTSSSNVAGSAVFTAPPEQGMNTAVNGGSHTAVGQMQAPPSTGGPAGSGSSWAGNPSGPSGGSTLPPTSGGTNGTVGTGPTPGQTNPNYVPPTPNGPGNTGPGPNGPGNTGPGRPGPGVPLPGTPGGGTGSGRGTGTGTGRGGPGSGTGRGGAGGTGSGTGRGGAGGVGAGGRGGAGGLGAGGNSGIGRGGMAGVGGGAGAAGGAAGAGGRGGSAGAMGGAGARGQGANGEEDEEHYTPEFLKGDHGFFDDDMPKVAPPVFGDWENK